MLLLPSIALFAGFVIVPMIFAAWYSLYNWSGFGPLNDFIVLQNYADVLDGPGLPPGSPAQRHHRRAVAADPAARSASGWRCC